MLHKAYIQKNRSNPIQRSHQQYKQGKATFFFQCHSSYLVVFHAQPRKYTIFEKITTAMALYPQHDHEYIVFCDMFLLCRIVTEASPQNVSMCILTRPFSMYTQICVRTICTCSEAPYTIRISIHHQIQEKRYPYVYVGNMQVIRQD